MHLLALTSSGSTCVIAVASVLMFVVFFTLVGAINGVKAALEIFMNGAGAVVALAIALGIAFLVCGWLGYCGPEACM